jgi:hypothetical protein
MHQSGKAQNLDILNKRLVDEGFENVIVMSIDSTLHVSYENRVYRFEVDAIRNVLELIAAELADYNRISLIVQNKNIPIVKMDISSNKVVEWLNKNISSSDFTDVLNISLNTLVERDKLKESNNLKNSANMKFDFVLKPTYKFQFGIFSDPVLYQLNLAPHFDFNLWKGATLRYELTIPIHNDFAEREDSIRTTFLAFNQTCRLSNSFFLSASLGYFSQNRYGFDLEAKNYFDNGNLALSFNAGYTGFATFSGKRLFYSDLYQWTGSVSIDYRIPVYDLTLSLSMGKYLLNDNTLRVDINREFGEIQIGFFALKSTSGVSNGGINISIPLYPSKYWKPKFVRFRTFENLSYSYLVKNDQNDLIGLRYNSGFRLIDFIERMNPGFIKNYIKYRLK